MDDYISLDAAIEAISEECKVCGPSGNCPFIMNCHVKQKRKALRTVPPAAVRPAVEARWVELPRNTPNPITGKCGVYVGCSNCHAPLPTDSFLDYLRESDSNFCYSCGAKMGGTPTE